MSPILDRVGKVFQDDNGLGARVDQLVLQLARRVQRIDVDDHVAGAQHGRHGDRILQHVRQHDGDARAFFHAAALQPCAHLLRQAVQFSVGQKTVHACIGLAVGVFAKRFFQQVGQRPVLGPVDLRGYAFLVRLQPKLVHQCLIF
jgi:hypothetical protein